MQPFLQAADTGALAILLFNFTVKHVAFDLVYHAVCAWVLPIKNPRVYWTAAIACQIVGNMLLPIGPDPTQRVLWYLTDYVFIPYLCWRGPRTVRAVAIAIGVIAELTVETSTMVLYSVLGLPLTAQVTSSPLEFAVRVAGLVALAILGLALRRLFARQREAILAYDRTAADGSRPLDRAAPDGSGQVEDAEDAAPYGRFLATQGFVILVLYTAYFCGGLGIIPTSLALVMLGVTLFCAVADIAAVFSLRRFSTAQRERARAAGLEAQLAVHADAARRMAREAEAAARFRHDQRNHLQVIGMLVERGELERARAYVAELRAQLAAWPKSASKK